jgi:hypothetical protein
MYSVRRYWNVTVSGEFSRADTNDRRRGATRVGTTVAVMVCCLPGHNYDDNCARKKIGYGFSEGTDEIGTGNTVILKGVSEMAERGSTA